MSFTESLDDLVAADRSGLLAIAPRWGRVRLGDVCSILNGYPFPSQSFRPDGGMPLIRIRDVRRGSTETHFVGEFDPAYVVRHGDLLVGMDGDFNCAAWTGSEALLNQRVCKLDPDEARFARRFLLLALPGYLAAINRKTSSITVKHLSSRTVQEIPLPLPPRQEQDQIADTVEAHFSRLDAATATLERVQRNLERYRASVLKAAVEGRLVPTEAELAKKEGRSYEPASVLLKRILAERRRRWEEDELARLKAKGKVPTDDRWKTRYEEPAAPDTEGLPELPEGWCWTSVDAAGDVLLGRRRAPEYGGAERPYLRVANVRDDRIDFTVVKTMPFEDDHFERHQLVAGDILVSEGQSPELIGQSAIFPPGIKGMCFQSTLHRFRAHSGVTTPAFAQLVFRSHVKTGVFRRFASITTNIAHLVLNRFKVVPMPLPPLSEQARIVEMAGRLLTIAERGMSDSKRQHSRISRLRQSILKWAFEGRLESTASP